MKRILILPLFIIIVLNVQSATFTVNVNDGGWGDVSTPGTLAKAIADFNAAGAGAHTINILTTVSLTDPAKWALNNAAAILTINGGGFSADGPGYGTWTTNVNRLIINNWSITAGFGTTTSTLGGIGGHSFTNVTMNNVFLTFTAGGNTLTNSTFTGPGGTYRMVFNNNNGNTVTDCYYDQMELRFSGSDNNTIRNTRFTRSGLSLLAGSDNNQILGCRFNLNAAGTGMVASGIAFDIDINNSSNNIIGQNNATDRNVFALTSTNSIRIANNSPGNQIVGNYFGTNVAGTGALSGTGTNSTIYLSDGPNTIIDDNVISSMQGTTGGAIEIASGNCNGLRIRNNKIGVDVSGAGGSGFGNANNGIMFTGGSANNTQITGNTIARSASRGIYFFGTSINPITISNNRIGSNTAGTYDGADYGNGNGGIVISGGTISNVTISNNVIVRNGWVTQDNNSCGIYVNTSVTTININNNIIGVYSDYNSTGPTGQGSGNAFAGIYLNSTITNVNISNNVIGRNGMGTTKSHGIATAVNVSNVTITNNHIGVTPTSVAIGNGHNGIDLQSVTNATISGNYIAANEGRRTLPAAGIVLVNGTNQVAITNNYIGVAPNGTAMGQTLSGGTDGSGIRAEGTANRIEIDGNVIANNVGNGVNVVAGADFVEIFNNSIYCNTGKGINLNCGGSFPNTPGNNSFGCGTITLNTFTPPISSVSGGRPVNSTVHVYGTNLCAAGVCNLNPQGQMLFTGGTMTYPTATTWNYNHGSTMFNDITALAVGNGSDCNGTYCRTSEFSNCVDNTLPVTLLQFYAEVLTYGEVVLYWSTSEERNTQSFILEKSYDAKHFEFIASINAAGNSSSIRHYNYSDFGVSGLTYYRLKIIDIDGSYEYSSVISVNVNSNRLYVYPNPATGALYVTTGKNNEVLSLKIYNGIGREIDANVSIVSDEVLKIDLTGLSDGVYYLNATSNTNSEVIPFLVK